MSEVWVTFPVQESADVAQEEGTRENYDDANPSIRSSNLFIVQLPDLVVYLGSHMSLGVLLLFKRQQ